MGKGQMSHGSAVRVKELRRMLARHGWVMKRRGNHEMWQHLATGATVGLPYGAKHGISRAVLRDIGKPMGMNSREVEATCRGKKGQ